MNSVTNKTRLFEKRYGDKVKNDKKESKLLGKSQEGYIKFNHQIQKNKKTTKIQKKYELNKRKKVD